MALANINGPDEDLVRAYTKLETKRISAAEAIIKEIYDGRVLALAQSPLANSAWFMKEPEELTNREFAYKDCFNEINNPKSLQRETWVTKLANPNVGRFGFVVYRLSYSEDEEAWNTFKTVFMNGLTSGWQGVIGAPGIRGKEQLYWIDGRAEKIPEGDVEAARV